MVLLAAGCGEAGVTFAVEARVVADASTRELVAGPAPKPAALYRTPAAKRRHVAPGKPPHVPFGILRYVRAP